MPLLYPYDYDAQLSTRSLGSDLTPNATQRTTLIVAGCYIIIIGILWYVPSFMHCVVVPSVDNPPPGACRHVPYLNFISESSKPLEPDPTVAKRGVDAALYSLPVQVRKKAFHPPVLKCGL